MLRYETQRFFFFVVVVVVVVFRILFQHKVASREDCIRLLFVILSTVFRPGIATFVVIGR